MAIHWEQCDLEDYMKKFRGQRNTVDQAKPRPLKPKPRPLKPKQKMNKTEAKYADFLEQRKHLKEIIDYRFEPFGLRLAPNTFYHPDFIVVFPDRFEIHEVKGFWRDDAKVKYKVAADMFPWVRFMVVKLKKGVFEWQEI